MYMATGAWRRLLQVANRTTKLGRTCVHLLVLLIGTALLVLLRDLAWRQCPVLPALRQKRSHKRRKAFDYMAISGRLSSRLRGAPALPPSPRP